jgi:flagellar basal-body rod modification protein FlgD
MAINSIDQSLIDSLGLAKKQDVSSKDTLGQSDFLKLMTTELNNQDPTKPMDSGEFFNQISQFSSVAGIQQLQNTFSEVANVMYSGQALQASTLVGRDIMLESSTVYLGDGGSMQGAVDLNIPADDLRVSIYSQSGELVNTVELGAHSQGVIDYAWDGKNDKGENMPQGNYVIKAEARYGRDSFSQPTWVKERIDSVTLGNGLQDIKLNMASSGDISFGQVKKIL